VAPAPVNWTLPARQDLLNVVRSLAEKSPTAAGRLLDRLETAAASLSEFPERGRAVPELGLPRRELIVEDLRLVYWLRAGHVEILRLIHGKQDFARAWRRGPQHSAGP